jgi:Spy/CpxP family protein refolding chaperone
MKRLVLPLMLLLGAPAFAQGAPSTDRQPQPAADADAGQLATKLGLDSAATAALRQTFAKYQAQLQPVRQDLWQTVKAIRQELAAPQPNSSRLAQLEDQLTSDKQKLQSIETSRSAELRAQLTPVQYGQLIINRRGFGRGMHRHLRGGHGTGQPGASDAPTQP